MPNSNAGNPARFGRPSRPALLRTSLPKRRFNAKLRKPIERVRRGYGRESCIRLPLTCATEVLERIRLPNLALIM
jgi:hypothetical protein